MGVSCGSIALAAVLVLAIGIGATVAAFSSFNMVAYSVAQRTKEIGIRLALGAKSSHILRSLSSQFYGTIIGGLVLGVLGAAGLAQLLRWELYGVSTIDPNRTAPPSRRRRA